MQCDPVMSSLWSHVSHAVLTLHPAMLTLSLLWHQSRVQKAGKQQPSEEDNIIARSLASLFSAPGLLVSFLGWYPDKGPAVYRMHTTAMSLSSACLRFSLGGFCQLLKRCLWRTWHVVSDGIRICKRGLCCNTMESHGLAVVASNSWGAKTRIAQSYTTLCMSGAASKRSRLIRHPTPRTEAP